MNDKLCVTTLRCLALDMIDKANSGHPGMALGSAAILHTIFSRHMVATAADPSWIKRDRFVLSSGHISSLLYAMLHVTGYDLTMDEVAEKAKDSTAWYKQHIFDVLTHKGYSRQELKPLFQKGGICDRVITYVSAKEAIEAIKADGGIAVMAHPGQSKTYDLIPDLVAVGLDGIEKYHPDHDESDYKLIDQLTKKYDLIQTTGSDFHHTYGPNRPFGQLVMDTLPFK